MTVCCKIQEVMEPHVLPNLGILHNSVKARPEVARQILDFMI